MDEVEEIDALLKKLGSTLASERASAAAKLLHSSSELPIDVLMRALENETVPIVKERLRRILKRRPKNAPYTAAETVNPELPDSALLELLDNAAAIVRHETEPAIGLIRRAATQEIQNFDLSKTNIRLESLRDTIDSIVLLLRINQPAITEHISLRTFLNSLVSGLDDEVRLELKSPRLDRREALISTNPKLLSFAIENALRNGLEAQKQLVDPPSVELSYELTPTDFSIRIINRFLGHSFSKEDVVPVGASSKGTARGTGAQVIDLVANRLGYNWTISGHAGVASFSMWGKTEDVRS